MDTSPDFDAAKAHRYFSATCFNKVWELIDRDDRTPADDEEMVRLAHASIWHWTQRDDCTDRNLSVGYWLLSRAYALAEQPGYARRYGQICLQVTPADDPFCLGYAQEALARSELVAGNLESAAAHLAAARNHAERVSNAEEQQMLIDDVASLQP